MLVSAREQRGSVELELALPLLLDVADSTWVEQQGSLLPPGFRSGVIPLVLVLRPPVEVSAGFF